MKREGDGTRDESLSCFVGFGFGFGYGLELFVVSVLVSIVCCRPIFILSSLPFFFLF
jgi:hypothetical protein